MKLLPTLLRNYFTLQSLLTRVGQLRYAYRDANFYQLSVTHLKKKKKVQNTGPFSLPYSPVSVLPDLNCGHTNG